MREDGWKGGAEIVHCGANVAAEDGQLDSTAGGELLLLVGNRCPRSWQFLDLRAVVSIFLLGLECSSGVREAVVDEVRGDELSKGARRAVIQIGRRRWRL